MTADGEPRVPVTEKIMEYGVLVLVSGILLFCTAWALTTVDVDVGAGLKKVALLPLDGLRWVYQYVTAP
jgi:hypothetical protein